MAASVLARGLQFAAGDRVGTAVAEAIVGASGAVLVAIAVMISTFGCNNGLILAGARVYYAMAKDGLFFRSVGSVNRHNTPCRCPVGSMCLGLRFVPLRHVRAIARLSGFRCGDVLHADDRSDFLFCVSGGRIWSGLIECSVIRCFRRLYLLLAVFIEVQLLRYKPQYTWPGLIIILSGVPVYWLWQKSQSERSRRNPERQS